MSLFRRVGEFLRALVRPVSNLVVSLILVALFVVIGSLAARAQLADFLTGKANLGEFLILFTVVCVFTFSYIAYRAFQDPTRLVQLRQDFQMLSVEYDPEEAYRQAQSYGNYIVGITLATAFAAIGLGLFFWPPPTGAGALIDVNTLQAMRYGFLGAYVFSLQLIYRRYTTYDMQPAVYLYCAFALAMGLMFNLVAFEALSNIASSPGVEEAKGIGAGMVAILAFSLGYFPNLAISWFNRVSYRALGIEQRRADALPLQLIDGISPFHEVRLRDNGVDNVQNLAAADIGYVLVHSAFNGQEIVDWIDQAILYLYLDSGTIESFRRAGLRSMSDFYDLWNKEASRQDTLPQIANQLQITDWRLKTLMAVILRGPNVHHVLNYWDNVEQKAKSATRRKMYAYLEDQQQAAWRGAVQHRTDRVARQALTRELEDLQQSMARLGVQPTTPANAEALVGQGVLYQEAGDLEKAAQAYKTAIQLDERYAEAYNSLAWLYVEHSPSSETLNEALTLAQRAVDLQRAQDQRSESYAAYLDTLATIQIKLGRLYDAERNLQEAHLVQGLSNEGRQYIERHLNELAEQKNAQAAATQPGNQPLAPTPIVAAAIARGGYVSVVKGVDLQQTADASAQIIRPLSVGEVLQVVDGPVSVDDRAWWKLKDTQGVEGWAAQDSLQPTAST